MTDQKEKVYTILIARYAEVEVFAESSSNAERYVKDMYSEGDCIAELGDALFNVCRVRELDSTGNLIPGEGWGH